MIENGVYLRLSREAYFEDEDRVGSTSAKKLYVDPSGYWYTTHHNPYFEETERTPEKDWGSALHVSVLEGDDAYDAAVAVIPDTYPGAGGVTKPWNNGAIYCKDWMAEHEGMLLLTEAMNRRCLHTTQLIRHHPDLGPAFRAGLSEVSVFFEHNGVQCRARFDKLLPKFVIDLKSFGGFTKGIDTLDRVLNIISIQHYDIQRYLYDIAREKMIEFIREGRVFGADAEERAWLDRLAQETDWKWVWLFVQRQDDKKGHAPIIKPIQRSRFDLTFDTGRRKVLRAFNSYKFFMDKFGWETPWALIEKMTEPPDHRFPMSLGDIPGRETQEESLE